MKMVQLDSVDKNFKKEYHLITDYNGDFIVEVPKGSFGFFPSEYLLKDIFPGQFVVAPEGGMSGHSSWDLSGPVIITRADRLKVLNFRLNSVGYAP